MSLRLRRARARPTLWRLHAVVVMPDHVHFLLTPLRSTNGQWPTIAGIVQGIKSATSHRINKLRRRKGGLWQNEYYDRIMRDEKEFNEKLNYIQGNGARSGLGEDSGDYNFWWEYEGEV